MSLEDVHDWVWTQGYLDRPRNDRWGAFADAKAQGKSFHPDHLVDALGLDVRAFVSMYRQAPAEDSRAAAKAEAKRLGLPFDPMAITTALRHDGWF